MVVKANDRTYDEMSLGDVQLPATFTLPNFETFRLFTDEDIIALRDLLDRFITLREEK